MLLNVFFIKHDADQIAFLNIVIPMQVTDVTVEVVEGDARNVMCEAVEKHHASILVVGSHGYGAIKRYSLSSCFPNFTHKSCIKA